MGGGGGTGERGSGERVSERKEKTGNGNNGNNSTKAQNIWKPRLLCFAVELGHASRINVPTAGPTKRGPRVACREQEHSASRQQKALFTALNPSERAPPTSLMRS